MIEKFLPTIKYFFFNFDYLLIIFIFIIWLVFRKKPENYLAKKITNVGKYLYEFFIKITELNTFKLLLIFFVLNFIIRLAMAAPVPVTALNNEAPQYLNLAQSIYDGEGFTEKVIWNNFLAPDKVTQPVFFRFLFILF